MATFAKFILLDSGRPVLINPLYVEQVRDGGEPDTTAIYFSGRSQAVVLQAKLETVMKQMFAPPAAPKAATPTPAPAATKAKPAPAKVVAIAPKAKRGG